MSDDDFDFSADDYSPVKKTAKKTTAGTKRTATRAPKKQAPAKQSRKALEKDDDDGDYDDEEVVQPKSYDGKTIEQIYQKKTPLEHVLLRPDTYVGSIEMREDLMWVYDEVVGMNLRQISYVPGLYKIFDEILVNAADNYQRDKTMDKIQVTIDAETNTISVWNNGQGIPVEIHAEEKMHVPEMIFGHLLTSSNYDDDMNKVTGGRNGYGAKLANIFSKHFSVECVDSKRGRKFFMEWENNMMKRHEPVIKSVKVKNDYTRVSFTPDLKRFGMSSFDKDIIALFTKRVYDVAGCNPKVKVYLNDQLIKISSFEKYVELYFEKKEVPHVFQQINERWALCVALSPSGQFQQVSFVNSICTTKGGTHVKWITEKLTKELLPIVNKKNKGGAEIKAHQIKNYLWVFVNSLIVNPAFDSQTKETLTSQSSKFGSKCDIPTEFVDKVVKKCAIIQHVVEFAKFKEQQQLSRKGGTKKVRVSGITKLDDANEAGGKNADKCTLILTEGDSAKTLAVSGLAVVGRDRYGVFPLKGKPLNVRDATHTQIMNNAEFGQIMQILGIKPNQKYLSPKGLRYGRLMIMTDQDHDGSHIKGLIINFIHHFWPDLLKSPGFLTEFITPIIKATKKKETISFYTITEYETWKQENDNGKGWKIKYYKGLGTSSAQEAKEYFSELQRHKIDFIWAGDEDGDAIDLAFNKKRVEDRKEWITKFEPGTYLDQDIDELPFSEFINKELIHFSIADCARSIPSLMDGLKPGQRKILYTCFSKNIREEIRVAQLSGYVSLHSAYHHGEESLNKTIVGMAHNFVGSNNINVLYPAGSFGSRLQGGKDAASARYLHTRLCDITRHIFHPDDDKLLNYLDDDGLLVEPEYYVPILPLVLVNGSEGIGTGWSTLIPNFNPIDIVDNIKRMLHNEEPKEMAPWYRGFEGTIEQDNEGKIPRYKITGVWNKPDHNTLEITELPIGKWTQDFKELLESMLVPDKKREVAVIKDYSEHHTDSKVHFVITLTDESSGWDDAKLEKEFKLSRYLSMNNMHLFDRDGHIVRHSSSLSILSEFYNIRLDFYDKRKKYLIDTLSKQLSKLDNQVRFILAVIKKELVVSNRKKTELLAELEKKGFDKFENDAKDKKSRLSGKKAAKGTDGDDEDDGDDEGSTKQSKKTETGYNYLLTMPIWNLTAERVEKLTKQRDEKQEELDALKATPIKDMWKRDLDAFLEALQAHEEDIKEMESRVPQSKKVGKGRKRAPARRKPAAKKESDDDDDFAAPTSAKTATTRRAPSRTTAAAKAKKEKDDSEGEVAPPAKRAAIRKAATATKKDEGQKKLDDIFKKPPARSVTKEEKEDYDSGDEVVARTAKLNPKGKATIDLADDDSDFDSSTSKGKEAAKSKAPAKDDSEVDESPVIKRRAKTTAKPAPASTKKAKALLELSSDDSDSDDDSKKPQPAPKAKATSRSAPAKAKTSAAKKVIKDDSEEEEDAPKKPPAKATKAAPARKAAAKKKLKDDSEEEEAMSEEDSDDAKSKSSAKPPKRAPAPSRRTKAKALSKNLQDSSDDDSDDGGEEESYMDDGDDDDYSE